MSKQYNKITFVGHLGSAPEMRYTPAGKPVTSFSVASNDQYTNANGQVVKVTTWFRCSSWGKQAEVLNQYLKKGAKVLIEGKLAPDENGGPRIWTDNQGGARASFEVTVKECYFLDSKEGNGNGGAAHPDPAGAFSDDDNIPF